MAGPAGTMLRDHDFRSVQHMTTEFEALQALASGAKLPDLIMLASDLPDGHGLNVLKSLQKMPTRSETKVVFYAIEHDTYATREAKELGADAVMQTRRFDEAVLASALVEAGLLAH
ncbi:MAG: response regulator [Candidatus Kaiserbacteria bacterium]|nr:response regulator [Candidatus Kaiserbacteria bacterium]